MGGACWSWGRQKGCPGLPMNLARKVCGKVGQMAGNLWQAHRESKYEAGKVGHMTRMSANAGRDSRNDRCAIWPTAAVAGSKLRRL
jgi:hypothetical protein